MNKSTKRPHSIEAEFQRVSSGRTVLAQAISLAFLTMGAAQAQQNQTGQIQPVPQALETVTVTGIRRGIEDAISVKKNSDSIVESISAEDIGKLPDATVAESISRLPGVATQRSTRSGLANQISVRGFSPDFNGTLLNGREQASTGESRGVEFDLFPASLLKGITLYKTPDGQLVGQGLSSTIDMLTVRPLEFGARTVAAGYQRTKSGLSTGGGTGTGERANLSYIDQFANRTFGVALGFNRYKDSGSERFAFNSWGGWTPDVNLQDKPVLVNGVQQIVDGKPVFQTAKAPGGFTADTEQLTNIRNGANATLQFKPNKNFETSLDVFYSKGETASKKTGLEGAVGGLSAGPYDPSGVLSNYTVANGFITSGTIDKYKGVVRNHIESAQDNLLSVGLNAKFKVADWTGIADVSKSKAKKDAIRYETTAGQPGNATTLDTISWTGFNGSNFADVVYKTGLNYSDRNVVKLTDVEGWSGGVASPQAGYFAAPKLVDEITALRLSGSRDFNLGPITSAEFGLHISDRSKTKSTAEGRLVINGTDPYGAVAVPGTGVNVAGPTGLAVVSFNPLGTLGPIYNLAAKVDPDILNKDWKVNEKVTTLYGMAKLDGTVGSFGYRGNFGLQAIRTQQDSNAFNVDRDACKGITPATCPSSTVSGQFSYTDVLPSLNLVGDLGNDQLLRMGLGKVLARPSMGDMRASFTAKYEANLIFPNGQKGGYAGDAGNPKLEPFRAKAFDISYEKYFGKKGYVSIAGFYKDLDSYVLKVGQPYDFVGRITPFTVPAGQPAVPTLGVLTTPINGKGGSISGIELAVSVPFSLLTPVLEGFGIQLNYSDTNSSLKLPKLGFSTQDVSAITIPLPGLSRTVSNLRVYYERNGFQVQVANRTRSDFLGEISDFQDNRQLTFIKAESTIDAQLAYEFQSGPVKGLSVLVQGTNLTNAKQIRYNEDRNKPTDTKTTGKSVLLGVNYKF